MRMIGTREIRVGIWEIKLGMRGNMVRMQVMELTMLGMQRMRGIRVRMARNQGGNEETGGSNAGNEGENAGNQGDSL